MITSESLQNAGLNGRVLARGEGFAYILPRPALRRWISNYTVTFPCAGMMSDAYSVIPHGSATAVFSCDQSRFYGNFFGPITQTARVGDQANRYRFLFIVEFQPAGYYAFGGVAQKELTGRNLPLDDVNPVLYQLVLETLESSATLGDLINAIDTLLHAQLKTNEYEPAFSIARQLILQSGGRATAKELSQNTFYSERQLGRIFETHMGISVKTFSRLVRFNKTVRLLKRRDYTLTRVCMEAGFYDISHFIRDFKSLCGVTPQSFRDNMSDFYNEIAKF